MVNGNDEIRANMYADMKTSKFHIGFPVDVAENSDTKYFLLYPDKQHRLLEKGKKKYESWKSNYEPEIFKKIRKVLPKDTFTFVRRGKLPPCNVNSDSASLAFVLAACSESDVLANSNDSKLPVFLFSTQFKIKPACAEEIYLDTVTVKGVDHARNSLLRKWNAVNELLLEGRKVVLFLYHEDAMILERALETKGVHIKKHMISEATDYLHQQYLFWNTINLDSPQPEIFSLKNGDFECLARSLGINTDKIEGDDWKGTALKVGGTVLGGIAALAAGYLVGKNKNK